jgi:hypothetical protein
MPTLNDLYKLETMPDPLPAKEDKSFEQTG